jgi:hypothetical protein
MFWHKPLFIEGAKDNYSLLISGKMSGDRVSPTYIWIQDGKLRFDYASYKNDGTEYIAVPIDTWKTNEWKHITCSWDNTQGAAIAVDGRIVAEKARTWPIAKAKSITIGGDGGYGPGWLNRKAACGLLDDLLIFNVPLSEKQMKAHFEGKLEYSYAAPLGKSAVFTKQLDPAFKLTFDENLEACAGKELIETLAVTPLTEGMHAICIYRNGELYRKRELLVIGDTPIGQGRPLHKVAENPAVRVIDDIDCTKEYGAEKNARYPC